jgi:hypothetical protein
MRRHDLALNESVCWTSAGNHLATAPSTVCSLIWLFTVRGSESGPLFCPVLDPSAPKHETDHLACPQPRRGRWICRGRGLHPGFRSRASRPVTDLIGDLKIDRIR